MNLFDILEEISVGYNSQNEASEKLKNYTRLVKGVLSEPNAIIQGMTITFSDAYDDTISDKNFFFQGSYATHTAIKFKGSEIDADMGVIVGNVDDYDVRQKIFNKLDNSFPNYQVIYKKPCITIDFGDDYHMDITVYSLENEEIFYHNAIPDSVEKVTISDPKGLVEFFNNNFHENDAKRKILRLFKYFVKITNEKLDIEKDNRLPSIALAIFIANSNIAKVTDEDDLYKELCNVVKEFKEYVKNNNVGPSLEQFYVTDTFYKIKDKNDVLKVLEHISIQLNAKAYNEVVDKKIFDTIMKKKKIDSTPSLIGTMG